MKILTVVATTGLALSTFSYATENIGNAKHSQSSKPSILITLDKLKAFPTAEGAGATATGGRGGRVIYVKNHNASGEGSLKAALEATGSRTIVFAVGGRFNINENIRLRGNHSNVTLAGQTANDIGGVHLAQSDFNICNFERAITLDEQKDIVFRYFDSRYNWQYLLTNHDTSKCIDGNGRHYNLSGQKLPTLRFVAVENLIIDHVSSGWSSYGLAITNKNHSDIKTGNITVQRSLMHEGIINPNGQNHNIGMLLGTKSSRNDTKEQWNSIGDFSIQKNAFIGVSHRLPNTAGGENAKFRVINNYIYGFNGDGTGRRLSRIGGNSKNDFVNNVYQEATYGAKFVIDGTARKGENANNLLGFSYGSFLPMKERDGLMKTPKFGIIEKPNFYIDGNLFLNTQGDELDITSSIQSSPELMTFRYFAYAHDIGYFERVNGKRVYKDDGKPRKEFFLDGQHLQLGARDNLVLRNNPLSMTDALAHPVSLLPSNRVKTNLLANVGGNVRYREDGSTYIDDPIDQRYIDWARNNSGPHSLTKSLDDNGVGSHNNFVYPNYTNGSRNLATYDSDGDGMPNKWEEKHQLNPNAKDNNEVRTDRDWKFKKYLVRNNAGYTNLEMYLADIAGDFHALAKAEGKPIKSNKDELKSITMLNPVIIPSTTAEVFIEYSAAEKRDIKCYLKNATTNKLVAFDKSTVKAGSGMTVCDLDIPANTPGGNNYLLYTYMTKANGKWSERVAEETKTQIQIMALTDDLVSVNIPSTVKAGKPVNAYINYSAKANRLIKCSLRNKTTRKYVGFDSVPVSAGIGKVEELDGQVANKGSAAVCNFDLPTNTPQGDYTLGIYMTKPSGKWSERFDLIMKSIKIVK